MPWLRQVGQESHEHHDQPGHGHHCVQVTLLEGATATHLLSTGTHRMVQARGSWASSQTLDMYYNRLHQKQNWEELLGGHAAAGIASASAVPPLPVSQPKPTEEGERRETQGGAQHKLMPLSPIEFSDHCTVNLSAPPATSTCKMKQPTSAKLAKTYTISGVWDNLQHKAAEPTTSTLTVFFAT